MVDRHDIIVVGASAGGVEALQGLMRGLPVDLPAAVFVVLHMSAASPGTLAAILNRAGPLPCVTAADGEAILPGRVYVAQPDRHLLVKAGHVQVTAGPRENRARPAIDPLFRSAAAAYGARVVGVVLTGMLDDGSAGLQDIHRSGGVTVVQDPAEALFPEMPRNAITSVPVDYVLPLADMPAVLVRLAREPVNQAAAAPANAAIETRIAEGYGQMEDLINIAKPSSYSCPECGGTLWEMTDSEVLRFRCQVGHAYSVQSLQADRDEELEQALWAALRVLEERANLDRRIVADAHKRAMEHVAPHFEARAREAEQHAETIRRILLSGNGAGKTAAG